MKPDNPLNVGDAHFRIAVDIAGDHVVGTFRYFKLPETWTRQREASHLANSVLLLLTSLLMIGLSALAIILFVKQVQAGEIPWRRSLWVGVVMAGLMAKRLSRADEIQDTVTEAIASCRPNLIEIAVGVE